MVGCISQAVVKLGWLMRTYLDTATLRWCTTKSMSTPFDASARAIKGRRSTPTRDS